MKKIVKLLFVLCLAVIVLPICVSKTVYATGEENPRVVVDNFKISKDEIIPGEDFDLTLEIRNTSQFYDVYSVIVSVYDKTDTLSPVYGKSAQTYIDRVYARNSTTITIPMHAEDTIDKNKIPLEITITYNDNYYIEKQTNVTGIYIPVREEGDLNVTLCTVPSEANLGTKARIAVTYENLGSRQINNIQMKTVTTDPENPIITKLYSLSGGSSNTAEVYVTCNETGTMPVKISFTYEEENGNSYESEALSYKINVNEMDEEPLNSDVHVIGGGVSIYTFILLALIVLIAIIMLIVVKKRRR